MKRSWGQLCREYKGLKDFTFPRKTIEENDPGDLYVFSDASADAYGFCSYTVQNGQSNLFFAKGKIVPLQEKALPTLELLGAYLALKCLSNLLVGPCSLKSKSEGLNYL